MKHSSSKLTPAQRSKLGKLLKRYNQRIFNIGGVAYRFVITGKGRARRYGVEQVT
jgi:hypothetical protein